MDNRRNDISNFYQDAVLKVDKNKDIISVSPGFYKQFHIHDGNLIGQSIHTVIRDFTKLESKHSIFSLVYGTPSLIKQINTSVEVTYYLIISEGNINFREWQSFLHSINPNNHKRQNNSMYTFNDIIGEGKSINHIKELASKIAVNNSTILLSGESGTGKELFAQAIHRLSVRKNHPFIAVNCVAIPDELFESELFGYEAGAFSGAKRDGKPGKIELAQHGTLFLDEVSELSFQAQGKLLRVLQEREVDRLGSTTQKKVDIRIIAATNRDLKKLVEAGKFRQDLFYRLYIFDLRIPALRERKEDILLITEKFVQNYNDILGREVRSIEDELSSWLVEYDWPGNVRELKAYIERGMNIVEGSMLKFEDIKLPSQQTDSIPKTSLSTLTASKSLTQAVEEAEIKAIRVALKEAEGDRSKAAHILDIHLASLYRKINKYGLK
ncbi:sigma-54 interaction domain-containing protein [Oceanobacillus sp. 1P07AA]|uniref:sigma-54 interaction domain-containing protein n=1 Tax=Oceanobacillus sp. 1P07AA TaxID=3132293 RepID=UPI0039A4796A